jgi:hypothetical protein
MHETLVRAKIEAAIGVLAAFTYLYSDFDTYCEAYG